MSGPNWLSSLNLDYEDAPAAHIPESTGDDADWMNSLQAWTTFDDHHFVGSNNNNNSTATTSSSSSFFPPTKNQLEQQQQHSEKIFENVFAAAGGTQPAPTAAPHALPSAYATLGTAIDGSNLVLDPTYPTSFAPAAADGSFNNSNNPARSHAPAATNADSASFGSSSSLNKKSILAATPADAFAEAQQSKKSKISSNTGFTPAAVSISPLDAAVTGGSPSQGPTISSPANSVASSTATPSAASASAVAPKPRGGQNKKIKLPKNADQLDPEDLANRMAMEEDKRRRNTAASGVLHFLQICSSSLSIGTSFPDRLSLPPVRQPASE